MFLQEILNAIMAVTGNEKDYDTLDERVVKPSLSVQTFCVHTSLEGGGSSEFWTKSKISFLLMASLANLYGHKVSFVSRFFTKGF